MEALIIILVVAMLYFVIGRKCPDAWDGTDIDGGTYGRKAVKKRTRKKTDRAKKLPKTVRKKTPKRKVTKRKTKRK